MISELRLHRAAQGRGRRGRVARRQLAGGAEDAEGEGEAAGQSGRSVAEGGEHAAMASAHMVGVPAKVDSDTKQVAVENTKRILVEVAGPRRTETTSGALLGQDGRGAVERARRQVR